MSKVNGRLEVDTIDAPAYWAPALINGDTSGLNEHEEVAVDAWLDELAEGGWYVVGTEEDSEYVGRFSGLQTDMVTYVIHRIVRK